jgi:hypothetical protein
MPCQLRSTTLLVLTLSAGLACALAGCGTTRSTDTARTATEQLLISDAIDRAVQSIQCGVLAGQTVYLDDSRLSDGVVDREYLVSTLRQHLMASGCVLRNRRDEADFIVEARVGAIGTDRNDLLFGIPAMNVPQILPLQGVPAAIPEVPLAKRRDQRGIAKIAVFAYHRATGAPVWQSGVAHTESSSNDVWIFGAGPFQRGTIYDGTEFAGKPMSDDEASKDLGRPPRRSVDLAQEMLFTTPDRIAKEPVRLPATRSPVVQASHDQAPAAEEAATGVPAKHSRSSPASPTVREPALLSPPQSAELAPLWPRAAAEAGQPKAATRSIDADDSSQPMPRPQFDSR